MQGKHNIISITEENPKTADNLLDKAIELFTSGNYKGAGENLSTAHKIYLANKNIARVSICLSLNGLVNYLSKKETYYKSLMLIEDSKFLAESSNNKSVMAINKFAFAYIYFSENKYQDAVFYFNSAVDFLDEFPCLKIKAYELNAYAYMKLKDLDSVNENLEKAAEYAKLSGLNKELDKINCIINDNTERNSKISSNYKYNKPSKENEQKQNISLLLALSKIARAVNAETGLDELLNTIAEQTKLVLNADRCSVFLYDRNKNELWSKVALGMDSEEIRFASDKGLAGYVVKTGETVKIKDAYHDSRFNQEIDKHTGYKTYNMICMPIRNIKYEIIGVFQVLNKKDGDFTEADEEILLTIGTNAGIAIENNILFNIQQEMIKEQKELFSGFIDTLAASIDARDKITLGHSNRVRWYSELICSQLGLSRDITEVISRAAMLHDIGKIGIKDAILQKKGTLTPEEYAEIKEHVRITYDILCKTNINSSFLEIAEIAASHHEKYDGTGYFRGLKGEEIPFGGRILAVSDVFDAITSVRHYRDRMPMEQALKIMIEGRNKHFDAKIVDAFLSITCDIITDVLISEYKLELKNSDRKVLSSVSLKQFYEILINKTPSKRDKKIIDIFNAYYIRNN